MDMIKPDLAIRGDVRTPASTCGIRRFDDVVFTIGTGVGIFANQGRNAWSPPS